MRRFYPTLSTLLALTMVSSTAWACGGHSDAYIWFFALIAAPFLAIPYALLGAGVLAVNARSWFARPFRGWLLSSIGAYVAAMAGVALGSAGAALAFATDVGGENLMSTLVLSTPLVAEVAYLMWLRTRAAA